MKIALYMTETEGERNLEAALTSGFKANGDAPIVIHTHDYDRSALTKYDLIVFVGVRRKSRRIYNHAKEAGLHTLMVDKGYMLRGTHMRFSVDGIHPWYLGREPYTDARLKKFGIAPLPRHRGGDYILFAGSSQKYCDFHELGDASDYAEKICGQLLNVVRTKDSLNTRVIYRPKPSWWGRLTHKRIPQGVVFSGPDQDIAALLPKCRCVVTHGSNTGIEALIAGIPVVTTATGPDTSPIYSIVGHDLNQVLDPPFPSDEARRQRLSELAWAQFSFDEIASSFAWSSVRHGLKGAHDANSGLSQSVDQGPGSG
jgi:hypothetical protein